MVQAVADVAIPSAQPSHEGDAFITDVPARLDRLPWGRFHTLVVGALGITWILDGLEVTMVGSLGSALADSPALHLGSAGVGFAASAYLVGAVVGAVFFGWLTDRLGRKKLFSVTVAIYAVATVLSGFAWSAPTFILFRALTGAGIGGEYAAINATIQELIPARKRGFTDLVINGSWWVGAALGAVGALVALDPNVISPELGWRVAFVIGGIIGVVVLVVRRFIPESPRWLMTHGEPEQADRVVRGIEDRVRHETGADLPPPTDPPIRLRRHHGGWFRASFDVLLHRYRRRTIVGVALMAAQAFCYNAVFFTYALILTRFYHVPSGRVGLFILPFAARQFRGSAAARAAVRQHRTAGDDRRDLRALGRADGGRRLAVRAWRAGRDRADGGLDDYFLLRLGGRVIGVSDGRRDLSARGAGGGDRPLLCFRHRDRRHCRAGAVRRADRERLAPGDPGRLPARRRADGGGRDR